MSRAIVGVAVGGVVLFLAAVVAEHALTPSLDPARHEVSEYVNAGTGAVMTAGFVAWTVSLAASAACARHERALAALLALASLGMALTACCPTQTSAGVLPPGATLTTSGRLHDLGSGAASLALLAAAIASAASAGLPRAFRVRTLALVALALGASVALLAIGPSVGGARQRLVVLVGCAWQLLLLDALGRSDSARETLRKR